MNTAVGGRRALVETGGVFLSAFVLLMAVHANRLQFTNDEGIILEAAQRIAQGQTLYVDFFGYMSPGSYWLQAFVFQLFGFELWAARLPVILDFSLQCALIFWLVRRLASGMAAAVTVVLYACLLIPAPGLLTAQHRWDSSTLSLLAIVLAVEGIYRHDRRWWFASGGVIAAADFFTPSVGLIAGVTVVWLMLRPAGRRQALSYIAGGLSATAVWVGALLAAGVFEPFLAQIAWLRQNYSGVNVMPYGSIIGGYGSLFEDASGIGYLIIASIALSIALPAVLPVFGTAGWVLAWATGRTRSLEPEWPAAMTYLVISMLALIASCYPRPDVMHLTFVSASMFVVAAALISRCFPKVRYLALYVLLWAVVLAGNHAKIRLADLTIASPVGELEADARHAAGMERLFDEVHPGDSLYVHPYMPQFYFLTQSANPTRYSYLAPGMMGAEDEQSVLADLRAAPPEWVLYLPLSKKEFVRVFPNASELSHRFTSLEQWLEEHYEPLDEPVTVFGYRLLRREKPAVTSGAYAASTRTVRARNLVRSSLLTTSPTMLTSLAARHSSPWLAGVGPQKRQRQLPANQKARVPGSTTSLASDSGLALNGASK